MQTIPDFSSFQEEASTALVRTTRTTAKIASEDLSFHRTFDANVSEALDVQKARLLGLTTSLLNVATKNSDLKVPNVRDEEGLEDNWRAIVDVFDEVLEGADACLDEFTGIIKRQSPSEQERSAALAKQATTAKLPKIFDVGPSKIPKPQQLFDKSPASGDTDRFKPLLRSKPHALIPLEESVVTLESGQYRHPYETEIKNSQYPSSVYETSPVEEFKPFESTTATFVDTLEGVHAMVAELLSAKEIAVDLEHHDLHSYYGIVSLMQISTRDKDWIVDTLKPWREDLQVLNLVFANPNILKVFHGSAMDIIWLQRDLGLYVIALFDTYHASVALGYTKRSLKFLLEKFVNFQADKQYQMADWRIRPLPPGMFDYARSDTHYLLYIYDHLRNELLENSTPEECLVNNVLEKSKVEALQRYERPVYDHKTGKGSGGWYDYLTRGTVELSREGFAIFKAVHAWRDAKARQDDEGVQVILTKRNLFKLAEVMPLDTAALSNSIRPVSETVRANAPELVEIIKAAKLAGSTGPKMQDALYLPHIKFSYPTIPQSNAAHIPVKDAPTPAPSDLEDEPLSKASRNGVSSFWGPAMRNDPSSDTPSGDAWVKALRLSLPLPPASASTSIELDTPIPPPTASSFPTKSAEAEPKSAEIFTVKEMGGRQKRKVQPTDNIDTDLSQSVPNAGDDDVAEEEMLSLSIEKPSKKERRRMQKNASPRAGKPDTAPFDYSTADSVLHAKPDVSGAPIAGKSKQKPFDPYAKSLNAPQGMRRQQKETPGKTFTFRQ